MSGGFVCACSGAVLMGEPSGSASDAAVGDLPWQIRSSRRSDGSSLSRAQRLEIICQVAALGISECSGWIIPMLEHGGGDQDQDWGK